MNKKNITILMQGPIYRAMETLRHYNYYINQGFNVLISTWSSKEEKKLTNCNKIVKKLPEIIRSINYDHKDPKTPALQKTVDVDKFSRKYRTYYQVCSILNGLDNITTDYVIKTRNDSFYSKLDYFAQVLLDNPDNYVCNNIFFRPDAYIKFHPSDHLFGMTKDTMYQVMFSIKNFIDVYYALDERIDERNPHFFSFLPTAPEVAFMKVFLMVKGIKIDERISKKIMKENVSLVPLSELGKYKFQWNCQNITFTNMPNEYMTNFNRWGEKILEHPLTLKGERDYAQTSKEKNVPLSEVLPDGYREFNIEINDCIKSMDEL